MGATLEDIQDIRRRLKEDGIPCELIAMHPDAAAELDAAWPGLAVFRCEVLTSRAIPRDVSLGGPREDVKQHVADYEANWFAAMDADALRAELRRVREVAKAAIGAGPSETKLYDEEWAASDNRSAPLSHLAGALRVAVQRLRAALRQIT